MTTYIRFHLGWAAWAIAALSVSMYACGDGGSAQETSESGASAGTGGAGSSTSSGGTGGNGGSGQVSPDSRCLPDSYDGPAIYVGLNGNDNNKGTKDAPVLTFSKALELRSADQDIRVLGGTYTEKLLIGQSGTADKPIRVMPAPGEQVVLDATGKAAGKPIDITGQHVLVQGFEVKGSGNQCVDASGSDIVLCGLDIHDCQSHGLQIGGSRVWAEGNSIQNASLENEGGSLGQSGWGSGLKVKVGGNDITLFRNKLFHNWGEGMAVTRGFNVKVLENLAYDNFSVNFYIDNSYDITVEKNMATCVENSGYEREGKRASAYMIGEEYYDGWGAQLHNVTIRNNLAAFCNRGFLFAGSDVGGGLIDVALVHNTFWGSVDTALSIAAGLTTKGTVVHNNLVQQPAGKTVWIESIEGITVSHNFWVNGTPADWTNGSGMGDLTGDAGFLVTPDYKAISFRLGEMSAARDSALVLAPGMLGAVGDDFEHRPRNEKPDMGAMEFGDPSMPCAFDALWK